MGDLLQVDLNVFNYKENSDTRVLKAVDNHLHEQRNEAPLDKEKVPVKKKTYRLSYRNRKLKKEKAYLIIKRMTDISVSCAAIAVLSPVFATLSVMIRENDGGQPIYSQVRLGQNGKPIRIYKFRSMRMDAENIKKLLTKKQLRQFYDEYKVDNDPRVTKLGRILRKTSIDELPQLFNILEGDMSLIGPRPVIVRETKNYKKKSDLKKLLSVKPGLSGFWQAYARNKATYKDGLRQSMELYYCDHRSLYLDTKIFFKTIISVINQEGAQ